MYLDVLRCTGKYFDDVLGCAEMFWGVLECSGMCSWMFWEVLGCSWMFLDVLMYGKFG